MAKKKDDAMGLFTSPEFVSQIGSGVQRMIHERNVQPMRQTALATAPFSSMSGQILRDTAGAGASVPTDVIGETLQSSAIRDRRLAKEREKQRVAGEAELERARQSRFDKLRERRMKAEADLYDKWLTDKGV